jgi:hypothetical protein
MLHLKYIYNPSNNSAIFAAFDITLGIIPKQNEFFNILIFQRTNTYISKIFIIHLRNTFLISHRS